MFKSVRKPVSAAAVIFSLCAGVWGQGGVRGQSRQVPLKEWSRGSDVRVDNDEFTGVRTISFESQILLDSAALRLSLSAEAKLGGNRPRRGYAELDDRVTLTFTSMSDGVDFGDNQVHFLVDGERVRGGKAFPRRPFSTGNEKLPVGGRLMIVLPLSKLQQIARGGDVQMRLGPVELTVDSKVRSVLREFVAACGHTNP